MVQNDYKHDHNYIYNKYVKLYQNYVFPVKNIKKDGYCSHLCERFKISDPLSWALFNTFKEEVRKGVMVNDIELITIKNKSVLYYTTDFGLIEKYLEKVEPNEVFANEE